MSGGLDGAAQRRLLNAREREWLPLLRGVSLVAEGEVAPEHSHEAAAALGSVYASHFGTPLKDKPEVFRSWPACMAVALAGVAATEYEYGTYWPALWEIAGYPGTAQDQKVWGLAFSRSLERLGMPTFPGMHHVHIGPILMHAGIPSHCLGDLLRLLLEQSRRDPGLDADSFMGWALTGVNRLNTLDKPVQRFLLEGGDYAHDTLDRVLDLLGRLRDPEPDLFGVGLPERLVEEAASLARRGLLDLSPARHGGSHGRMRTAQPRVRLDPFGEGPVIALPPSDDPEHEWRVVVEGQPHTVPSYSSWSAEDGMDITFPIPRPVRQVQVTSSKADRPTDLPVIEEADPLLFFTEDGHLLPSTRSLPRDRVWALYPAERTLSCDGEIRVICEMPVPFGWYGWVLEEIDLAEAAALGLEGGPARKVHGSGQPRLLLDDPVRGVTNTRGAPVYAEAPLISLPGSGGAARAWHIQIRDLTWRSNLSPIRRTAVEGDIDPWGALPRPITGTFDISVIGPLGYRLHRQITLAEGISAAYEPAIRRLTPEGLEPAVAHLRGAALVEPEVSFTGQTRERVIDYGALRLLVVPPHLQVLRDDGTPGVRWSSVPLTVTAESFSRPGVLLVRGPADVRLSALHVSRDSAPIQDVPSSGVPSAGQARFELIRIKDTVEAHRSLHLTIDVDGRPMPLAWIRPRGVATGVTLRGTRLQLRDFTAVPGLRLGVYPVYAPWRGASVLPVSSEGATTLPVDLTSVGPLVVFPRAETDGTAWPYWPEDELSLCCTADGWPRGEDEAEVALAKFVAGRGPLLDTPDLERLWLLCDLSGRLEALGAREDLRPQCAMYLRNRPKSALLALAATRLPPEHCLAHMIETGLAGLQPHDPVDPSETRHLWARLPAAAALLTGRLLLRPETLSELFEVVVPQYGQAAADLLLSGTGPYGEGTPTEDGAVPASPLSPGRLTSLVAELEDVPAPPESVATTSAAEEALALTPYADLTKHIAARPAGPARLSIACALIARAGAWGRNRDCKRLEKRHRSLWAELARHAPDLVAFDLVLAQALVTGVERARHLGDRT